MNNAAHKQIDLLAFPEMYLAGEGAVVALADESSEVILSCDLPGSRPRLNVDN